MIYWQVIRIFLSLSLVIAVWRAGGWIIGLFALVTTIRFELEQYIFEVRHHEEKSSEV